MQQQMTREEAIHSVNEELDRQAPDDDRFIIIEEATIDKPYGWVFFYNSKKFIETGQCQYRLYGNGPVIVNRIDGSIQFCGTARPEEELIAEYEKSLRKGEDT